MNTNKDMKTAAKSMLYLYYLHCICKLQKNEHNCTTRADKNTFLKRSTFFISALLFIMS